jgi:hypothetical protein
MVALSDFSDIWWNVTMWTCIAVSGCYFLASFWSFRGFSIRGFSNLVLPVGFAIAGFVIAFFSAALLSVGVAGMYTSNKATMETAELAIFVGIFTIANLFFALGSESSIRIL